MENGLSLSKKKTIKVAKNSISAGVSAGLPKRLSEANLLEAKLSPVARVLKQNTAIVEQNCIWSGEQWCKDATTKRIAVSRTMVAEGLSCVIPGVTVSRNSKNGH